MSNVDSNQFNVNLVAFNGPLDVLLDLAKSQKVNLEDISVAKLADQFHAFITKAKKIKNSIRIFVDGYMVNLFKIKIITSRIR